MENQKFAVPQHPKKMGHGLFFWIVIPLPFVAFALLWWIFELISGYVWIGTILALLLCIVPIGLVTGAKESLWIEREENPVPVVTFTSHVSTSLLSIFVLMTIFAWFSYALYTVDLAKLSDPSGPAQYGSLIRTYAWHIVDLIPFTNVEKTFGMKAPLVQFKGWIGGFPILVYRLIVVIIIFSVILEAWYLFQQSSRAALLERLQKRISGAKSQKEEESSTHKSE